MPVIYTPKARRNLRKHDKIGEMLEAALKHFPEIERIKIGWTSRNSHYAVARECVRVGKRCDIFGIAHELVHHLQYTSSIAQQDRKTRALPNGIPRGEKSCDIYAFSRSPELVGGRSHYVKMPKKFLSDSLSLEKRIVVCETAREAIRKRNSGTRNYIKWFEEELTQKGFL